MSSDAAENLKLIEQLIRAFVSAPERNSLKPTFDEPMFDSPLVGVAQGNAPLFQSIRDFAGPEHWLPEQAFSAAFPDQSTPPEQLSVISWVLPYTEQTRIEHRRQTTFPGLRWSLVRRDGELFNASLGRHLAEELTKLGFPAAAPALQAVQTVETFTLHESPNWSGRHVAYACGLGTFGINGELITPKGTAMTAGSVVAKISLPSTPHLYASHTAWCLYHTTGACLACFPRCPAGAITAHGRDEHICRDYIVNVTAPYVRDHQLGELVYSCGLCRVGTPCEARVPQQGKTRSRK